MKKVNHTIRIVTNKMGQGKVDRLVDEITDALDKIGITAVIFVDEPAIALRATVRGEAKDDKGQKIQKGG